MISAKNQQPIFVIRIVSTTITADNRINLTNT